MDKFMNLMLSDGSKLCMGEQKEKGEGMLDNLLKSSPAFRYLKFIRRHVK
jgi:hypothetical protein